MLVLLTLAAGQFLMTLDSSVMNVSIATVAEDVGTTVTFLEGVGAALIMPAIVALVAGNFAAERRPAAYGLVAAAGAVAVAVGPLIGGFCTTYFSWRWVFAGEVVVVLVILLLTRRIADAPVEERPKLDVVGSILSALGLGLVVFGVLSTSEWGLIQPKPDGPSWANLSPPCGSSSPACS
jgi:MFS family permease